MTITTAISMATYMPVSVVPFMLLSVAIFMAISMLVSMAIYIRCYIHGNAMFEPCSKISIQRKFILNSRHVDFRLNIYNFISLVN